MFDEKKKRKIIITIISVVMAIILISIVAMVDRARHSATLEIAVAPESATLLLNGKKYENGIYHLLPGVYEVSLTLDGMEPYSDTIELVKDETFYLYKYLTGPDGDLSWYYEHPDDAMIFTTISDFEANKKATEYAAQDPIFKVTPYYDVNNNHFKIAANYSENEEIVVTVNLNTCTDLLKEQYIKEANQYLTDNELELGNYKINYEGLCD